MCQNSLGGGGRYDYYAKHKWTDDEREYITRSYIIEYVLNASSKERKEFVEEMSKEFADKPIGSIRMFCQNISALTTEFKLTDNPPFSPENNYSKPHRRVFEMLVDEYGLV